MAKAKPKPLDPVVDFPNPVKKQADLPGMENRAITELEEAARKYAAIRDKRMALNDAEVKLQDILMALLKKHGKREYKHDGIEVWIKVEQEKVKVRIHEDDESPSEKEKKDAIRNETDPVRANSVGQGSTEGSSRTPDQSSGEDQKAHGKAGSAREPGDEGPEF
jgi:hypothetical protein